MQIFYVGPITNKLSWEFAQKSCRFAASFRVTIRLSSAFFAWRWFKLARICIQITCLQQGDWVESVSKLLSYQWCSVGYAETRWAYIA